MDFFTVVCLPFLTNWLNVGILFTSCDIVCGCCLVQLDSAHQNGAYPMHAPLLYIVFFRLSRKNLKFSLKSTVLASMTRLEQLSQIFSPLRDRPSHSTKEEICLIIRFFQLCLHSFTLLYMGLQKNNTEFTVAWYS